MTFEDWLASLTERFRAVVLRDAASQERWRRDWSRVAATLTGQEDGAAPVPLPLPPPWALFPHIDGSCSIGWRMGPGEIYWHIFWGWFTGLLPAGRTAYIAAHPEPDGFEGIYDSMSEDGTPA